jgi:hypothetical protein
LQRIARRAQEKREAQQPSGEQGASERLQAQREKQEAHAARLQASGTPELVKKSESPSGPTLQEQAQNKLEYQRKQAEAEKRRQEMARRKAEKAEKRPAPLPTPP